MDAGTSTSRRFREGWSLAAGTPSRPRRGVVVAFFVFAAVASIAAAASRLSGSRRVGQAIGPWVVALAYPSWLTVMHALREARRALGERRRRQRGGAAWWSDRAWPASGVERRIARGFRGPNVLATVAVAVTFGVVAAAHAALWRLASVNGGYMRQPEDWGWAPTTGPVVVAVFALPLLWLLVILGPRAGRGRLVVSWPQFPQRTGGRSTFHVGVSPGGAQIDGARVFLRCVRTRSRPLLPLAGWNARLLWVAEARLPLSAYAGPQRHLVVTFDVPADAPPTDLHAKDAVRWEVLVLGTVGGSDYADSVVVPVYAPAD